MALLNIKVLDLRPKRDHFTVSYVAGPARASMGATHSRPHLEMPRCSSWRKTKPKKRFGKTKPKIPAKTKGSSLPHRPP